MARKLAFARALLTEPQILILDEPFDGVYTESRQSMIKLLREWVQIPNRCILITSHNMADIEAICNSVWSNIKSVKFKVKVILSGNIRCG